MSISNSVEITFQPFQVPPAGGRPRGMFGATKVTTGDASGGDIFTSVNLSSSNPQEYIYQFDTVIISSDNPTTNIWEIEMEEGGLYTANFTLRGSYFNDQNEPVLQLKNYILYPVKGGTTLLKFQTDNDDLFNVDISVRGRYWERSYLRERGQTPLFL